MSRMYGPNTRLIDRFLERLATLELDDFAAIVTRWRQAGGATEVWCAAEDAVGDAIATTRRDDEMWQLHDRLYASFRNAPWYTRRPADAPTAPPEAASQYVATSAAVALLVADVLSAAHLNALYGPFAEAIPLADVALGATPAVEPRQPGGAAGGARRRGTDRDTRH
jgi:hypothetical protein